MSEFLLNIHEEPIEDLVSIHTLHKPKESIVDALKYATNREVVVDLEAKIEVCCAFVPTYDGNPSVLMRGNELYIERDCHAGDFSDHTFPHLASIIDDDERELVVVLLVVTEEDYERRLRLFEAMGKLAMFLRMENWFYNQGPDGEPSDFTLFVVNSLNAMQNLIFSSQEDFFEELLVMLDFWPAGIK